MFRGSFNSKPPQVVQDDWEAYSKFQAEVGETIQRLVFTGGFGV